MQSFTSVVLITTVRQLTMVPSVSPYLNFVKKNDQFVTIHLI